MEHLREHLHKFYGFTIAQVERVYKSTPCYPVPTMVPDISDAVIALAEDRSRVLGLKHPRGNFCGEKVILGPGELPEAVLAQPWPAIPTKTDATPHPIPSAESPVEVKPAPLPKPSPLSVQGLTVEERGTPDCQTKSELRQAVAAKLSDIEGNAIQKVQFQVYAQYENATLSDYPSAIRGALTVNGELVVQIDLVLPGPLDKAQVENLCESLPDYTNAKYHARMHLFRKTTQETARPEDGEVQ